MTTPAVGTFTDSLTHSLDTGIEPAFVLSLARRGGFPGFLVAGIAVCLQRSVKGVTNLGTRYLGSGAEGPLPSLEDWATRLRWQDTAVGKAQALRLVLGT